MGIDDFDDLLDLAGGDRRAPCLVELGRALRGDCSTIGYAWSTGRIVATVGPDFVRVRRRYGVVGFGGKRDNNLKLGASELAALAVACEDWAKRRDDWAAFYFSTSGYPAGFGGAYYYRPPGKKREAVHLGSTTMGRKRGQQLVGRDEIVAVEAPIELDASVRIDAEVWRRGEAHGPKEGSLVGLRYRLEGRTTFTARRDGANVGGAGNVALEPGEEDFIAALLDVVMRAPPRCGQ